MTTGLANEDQYFELVRGDLEDALGAHASLIQAAQGAAYRRPNPRTVRIRIPGGTHVVELARRAPVFKGPEAKLLAAYGAALQEFGEVPSVFATTASEDVLTRAIAVRCSDNELQARTVEAVIQSTVRYASRTYEGTRVSVNLCLDLQGDEDGDDLHEFLQRSWAPVLGSGLSSALLLGSSGAVLRLIDLPTVDVESVFAPEAMVPVAAWTTHEGRIALSISRSGEVYLFAGGQLLLARRSAQWRAFPVGPLLSSGWFGTSARKLTPAVKRSVLTSLIDASAAHHGAWASSTGHRDSCSVDVGGG